MLVRLMVNLFRLMFGRVSAALYAVAHAITVGQFVMVLVLVLLPATGFVVSSLAIVCLRRLLIRFFPAEDGREAAY